MVHQIGQHAVFMAGQRQRPAIDGDTAVTGVQRQRAAHQFGAGMATGTADQRAQAGQQFFHVEGFGQVIVGTGIDAGHFFVPGVARSQDQHRHRAPGGTPFFQHRDAIHLRQTEIQHDRVVRLGIAHEVGIDAVVRHIDHIAGRTAGPRPVARPASAHLPPPECASASRSPLAILAIRPLDTEQRAVAGIDLELDQRTARAQQLDLVNPARIFALQFNFHDLPRILALDPFQNRPQGQYLAGFQRLAGTIMIVPVSGMA